MKLKDYIFSNIKLEGNTIKYIRKSTEYISDLLGERNPFISKIDPTKIRKGFFTLIKYKFNSMNYLIPIFVLDFKIVNNNPIIYAINLSLLPFIYKTELFSSIFETLDKTIEYNKELEDVTREKSLDKLTNFDYIYNILQASGGYTYAIEAYSLEKISDVYLVSTNIAYRFLFLTTQNYNVKNLLKMKSLVTTSEKMKEYDEILSKLNILIESNNEQSIEYYKRLKSFEKHLKKF